MNIQPSALETDFQHSSPQSSKYNKGRQVKILLDATHAFCRFERPSQLEIQKYKELFYSLVDQVPMLEKREISIALARNHYTPRPVAIHLALGEVAGSTPVLLFSPVLKEVDLVSIAGKCPISGIRVLARRDGLSTRVIKAIDAREDAIATRILHLDSGEIIGTIQPILTKKPPIVPTFPVATETKTDDQATISKQRELLDLASRGGRLGKTKQEVSTVFFAPSKGLAEDLTNAARNRNVDDFCTTICREIYLDAKLVRGLLNNANPDGLCKLLKAMKIPNSHASQILLLLNKEIGASVEIFRSTMNRYDQLSWESCQKEFSRSGAKFDIGDNNPIQHTSPPQGSMQEMQNNASKLESALRRRQEALGRTVQKPLFNNGSSRKNTAA